MADAFESYLIGEKSYVAYIKREIHNLARHHFDEKRIAEIDIIVSELTSNIIKHAQSGELLYRLDPNESNPKLEIISIDNGPGMKDLSSMMKDGVSTTRTLGHGLGAIKRLSNFFQGYSLPNWGSVFYCLITNESPKFEYENKTRAIHAGIIMVSKPGEKKCGDGYFIKESPANVKIFLGDGLGHGPLANEAVQAAIDSFQNNKLENDPVQLLRNMHNDVKRTRGLVGTVVILNNKDKIARSCGIGNISTRIYNGIELKNNMSYNGILGLNIPNSLSTTDLPIRNYQTLIMCSDGIRTRWELSKYPNILKQDPIMIASIIYKDHARRNDDMSVLVAKMK